VKLVDANVLLYAVDTSAPQHRSARRWLEDALSATETVAFAWIVLLAFLRLGTNPRVFVSPLVVDEAFEVVESWLDQPNVVTIEPTDRHAAVLRELLEPLGTAANLVTDAHLAALAIEHGATLYSADADFSRFPRLVWVNPLTG
jgi:toxin-antitoxin system PIN domain toxin